MSNCKNCINAVIYAPTNKITCKKYQKRILKLEMYKRCEFYKKKKENE